MITKWNLNCSGFVSEENAKKAVKAPVTVNVKDFTPDSAKEFAKNMAEAADTGQDIIPVVIDSYGGQVYALLSMIDTINSSPVRVATIVLGKAMSCGSLLFSAGRNGFRFMGPNATLMVHEVSTAEWGKVTDVKVGTAEAERLNDKLFSMLDTNAGRVPGYFKKLVHDNGHADLYWTPEQAREHGLCDHVAIPRWEVDVRVTRALTF